MQKKAQRVAAWLEYEFFVTRTIRFWETCYRGCMIDVS